MLNDAKKKSSGLMNAWKKKVREKEVEEEEKGKRDYPHALR